MAVDVDEATREGMQTRRERMEHPPAGPLVIPDPVADFRSLSTALDDQGQILAHLAGRVASLEQQPATDGPVNEPISWQQLIGAWLSDYGNPAVILAFLIVIANWLQSSEPITTRGIVTVIVLALVAAMQAALHVTGSDGLARRLKARGQLAKR